MKKMTIRDDDYIYERINNIANDNKISSNKLIAKMIKNEIDTGFDINKQNYLVENFNSIDKRLNYIEKKLLEDLKVTKQHFANRGFLSNADVNEDKCLKEIFKNKFND